MVTWILTSAVIAALSAAVLELFRTSEPDDCLGQRSEPAADDPGRWELMSEPDLDALMEEFRSEEGVPGSPKPA
ncbi:MAG: hypothetical protein AB9869_04005 [Verrucomicrobiia bacterium]